MDRNKYHVAPSGEVFGKWRVLKYSHYDREHYWLVQCACGIIQARRAGQLVNSRTHSCRSCSARERESEKSPYWKGIDGISFQYITKLKYRNKEVAITLQDLVDKWEQQQGKCAYTDIALTLVYKDTEWTKSTASVDRIDSALGYVPGNVQWVHKRINTMKSDMTEKEFVEWCTLVHNKHGGSCGV